MAHARRKFHELWANHGSQVGEQALKFFGQLYEVERTAANADSTIRLEARKTARPLADALHQWLRQQRQRVPDGSATARAIDYSLKTVRDQERAWLEQAETEYRRFVAGWKERRPARGATPAAKGT